MWEISLVVFVKAELWYKMNHVAKTDIAKGFINLVGNKGGIAYSFNLCERVFTVVSCHLTHKAARLQQRNLMMSELVQ